MKVVVVCKSDSTGGAAVTSRRLTEALISIGEDATLLVEEKLSGLPFVKQTGQPLREKYSFLKERLHIFCSDGFSRRNLFKIDTGEAGLPLWRHPAVKEADAVILNWVNQGMLSLRGVERILKMGKRVIWTMHDMWNFTGICHHAMDCRHFTGECGRCFLLGPHAGEKDLSHKVWKRKKVLYQGRGIRLVAVSSWLHRLAKESSLLGSEKVAVIPNAFRALECDESDIERNPHRILMVAARLDDPIKGIDILREGIREFAHRHPELAAKAELRLIGAVKNEDALNGFAIKTSHAGRIDDPEAMRREYGQAAAVVSTSLFENLPGTLIEGQAYGCVPVAFDRGGQSDIIAHESDGYLMAWSDDAEERARRVADGIAWALKRPDDIRDIMARKTAERFSYGKVAAEYMNLIRE